MSAANPIDRLESLIRRLGDAAIREPEFATIAQAARRLGVGTKALRGAIQRGEIPVYHLGTCAAGRPRVHVPEVRAWALGTACDPLAKARAAQEGQPPTSISPDTRRRQVACLFSKFIRDV